ncbi:MAG: FKBP-type peptidyl-prolyl cis-trans isomerase [Bacteroidota bacterium]
MRRSYTILLLLFLFSGLLSACRNETESSKPLSKKALKQPLLEANRHAVKTEEQHIEDFLRRYKWDMAETGSGLRYMIYEKGKGPEAVKGKLAVLDYTLSLITGDVVYTASEDGLMSFLIGKGEVVSGLEEGILLLNVGDKAKFIIPSHLAFGLVGDDNEIPGKATLIYDITLLELNDQIN